MLALHDITKIYGEKLVLKRISLSLGAGQLALIVGPNGAGKTTILRIMAQLASPSSGKVVKEPGTRTGYLGHSTFLYPALSALENLVFQARINGLKLPSGAFSDILDQVRLGPYANEPVRHFSRGMAQRLNFARILMLAPDIFLLDEPFTGMDAESTRLLEDELLSRLRRGAAIAMISHSADDLTLATHVHELSGGILKFSGRAEEYSGGARAC